jgi:hypothetical protein
LLFGLGYLVFNLEKSVIIRNWDKRRCELGVMAASSYFKPSTDPRSDTQFAMDNFSFCTGRLVEQSVGIIFSPFQKLFDATTGSVGIVSQGMEIIRTILSKIKEQFEQFMDPLYRKYVATSYAVFGIFQHFRAAFERTNAIVLGMLFASLSIIRGMLNMKDFVVKIVLIILGIMVAAIIILFFVLFPFIPIIILPTIAAIEVAVGSGAVSGMRDAFCLAPGTKVRLLDGWKNIEDIRPGDGEGFVEAVIETDGNGVNLWNINGVLVSSYHIVWDSRVNKWVFAKDHYSAISSSEKFNKLYCLTTKTRKIIVSGLESGQENELTIRDWEELEDSDIIGNMWYDVILRKILLSSDPMASQITASRLSSNLFYKISGRLVDIAEIGSIEYQIGDTINENDRICGKFKMTTPPTHLWIHNSKGDGRITKHTNVNIFGNTNNLPVEIPITESGTIYLYDAEGKLQYIIQDMTEVGVANIHKTYEFILTRLNIGK